MRFNWIYPKGSDNYKAISKKPIFQQIKQQRNLSKDFLESRFDSIPDYNLLKDIDKAASRIIEAVSENEKIMIFGHDDLDGITATYILFDYLELIGYQNHFYYIPNRKTDKHGIQQNLIDKLNDEDFNLLITVDGGVSDFEAIDKINAIGCDVIITDHHMIQDHVPDAYAIVNPKQNDCSFPFDMIAGVTVSYFLVKKMEDKLKIASKKSYLFWVALGCVSDKVPLISVNRILVKKALEEWLFFDDLNIKILHDYLKPARNFTHKMSIIRNLIRLFSNGRLPNGDNKTLKFLISSEHDKMNILKEFKEEQGQQDYLINCALGFFEQVKKDNISTYYFFYDTDDMIPTEVMGLVASYISGYFKIPALILKNKNGTIHCEARATEGFNLVESFNFCSDCLIQYGGHAKAAGFTCLPKQVNCFELSFKKYIDKVKNEIKDNQKIEIDAIIQKEDLQRIFEFLETEYHFLQPYGEGNKSPVFLIEQYNVLENPLNIYGIETLDSDNADVVIRNNGSGFSLLDYRSI